MKKNLIIFYILFIFLFTYCKEDKKNLQLKVTNNNNINLVGKIIELDVDRLNVLKQDELSKLEIINSTTNKEVIYQLIDSDNDGDMDKILFKTNIKSGESKIFTILKGNKIRNYKKQSKVYARFVPERKDDFAWENDRIAFRMYGPALEATGEISNGIDVWVKSTRNLIIDKWYKGEDYHKDHGEGLDYYKVGPSLGCGGSALIENDTLNKSKNFVKWKILENGPIRTSFQLTYAPRKYKEAELTEVKRISLDAGENLNKVEVNYITDKKIKFKNVIGIVKHPGEDEGKIFFDKENGIFAYWEPTNKEHGNTMVGVIVKPNIIDKFKETKQHYLIVLKETDKNNFLYFTGAAWSGSGEFSNFKKWKNYLKVFVKKQNDISLILK